MMTKTSTLPLDGIILVASIVTSCLASLVDAKGHSPWLLGLQAVSFALSFVLAVNQIRTASPFYLDVSESDWMPTDNGLALAIPRSKHGRGRTPYVRVLVQTRPGSFAEAVADSMVDEAGAVTIRVVARFKIRVEIRK